MQSQLSGISLNGLNFFVAAVQTGFGPFVAVWLTQQGWTQTDIGLALSIGTAVGLLGQLPGGMLVDAVHQKRYLTAAALVTLAAAATVLATSPSLLAIWTAQALHALASCVITPAIAALTLCLCGHAGFSARLGVNARFAALGNAAGAAMLGTTAWYASERAVFILTAILTLPALVALFSIRPDDCLSPEGEHPALLKPRDRDKRAWSIFQDPVLHIFAVCAVLFHLSNTAMLPLALNRLASRHEQTGLVVSAAIVVPQMIVAALGPWLGRKAQAWGRRPVLLLGFTALPLRGALFALLPGALPLVAIQVLDGVGAAVLGLMVPLIAADVTRRNGFLNLAIGSIGLAAGLGATFSTALAGLLADKMGLPVAFLSLSAIGGIALGSVLFAMPETRPARMPSAQVRPVHA